MKLPTPDCPWCARRVEDRGDHFACLHCAGAPLPDPAAFVRSLNALMVDLAGKPGEPA